MRPPKGLPPAPPGDPLARAAALLAEGRLAEAAEAARAFLEAEPGSGRGWLLRGRAERLLAADAAERGDGTTAQLRLLDAERSLARALEALPQDAEAWREAGRILRDSFRFPEAAAHFRRALERSGARDGETVYDLAYCSAYGGDFAAALPLFLEAERLLGPRADIAVNAAICEERLRDRAAAVARLARFYAGEVAAGRGGGADARRALDATWNVTVQRRDYEAGRAAFAALSGAHPDQPSPSFMLGNLLAFLGEHASAAEAYGRSLEAGVLPAARGKRAASLAAAGMREEADATVREVLAEGGTEGIGETVVAVGRLHRAAGKFRALRDLVAEARVYLEGEPDLEILDGDAALGTGDPAAALEAYGRAKEASPFAWEPDARRHRAAILLAQAGADPGVDLSGTAAPAAPLPPAPPDEPLLDFDRTLVFVRAETAGAEGASFVEGTLRLPPAEAPADGDAGAGPRAGPGGGGARRRSAGHSLRVDFLPDLDAARWPELVVRVRTEGGAAGLRVGILDGYDETSSGFVRSRWPAEGPAAALGPEWNTLSVPLAAIRGFVPQRPLPPLLSRVRSLLLTVEPDGGGTIPAVRFAEVSLVDPAAGERRPLASLEGPAPEVALRYGGTCVPFARTLFTEEDVRSYEVPGTTPYAANLLGGAFDPALVGGGTGSLRLHHGETGGAPAGRFGRVGGAAEGTAGPATATVVLNPDRDLSRYGALAFLARGAKGGERLQVRIRDVHDDEVGDRLPAGSWPPALFPRTVEGPGTIVLGTEWRRYRIPFGSYPDFDPAAITALEFRFGDGVGNPPGTVLFLDDIGAEH